MWFKNLVGFDECSFEKVQNNLVVEGNTFISRVNGKSFQFGSLTIPTLSELRHQTKYYPKTGRLKVQEIVGDVQTLHKDPENKNALFQAASQFNLLEMVSPNITPEHGIDRYEHDNTQGPACAIACGAGTIYRNYFVPIARQMGQSKNHQIDCLGLIANALENDKHRVWFMRNGYALLNEESLVYLNPFLTNLDASQREKLKGKLKIGIQWDTEVTIATTKHLVSQAYCSALPLSYSEVATYYWESFARLILEATYEATLHAALINLKKTGCNKVFLTLVGGGVFRNQTSWIFDSIELALQQFKPFPLDIYIVSYGESNLDVQMMIENLNRNKE
jgi:hypothetical protein